MPGYIIQCTCEHEGQDKLHGKGNRVANAKQHKNTDPTVTVTCTICGAVKTVKK